MAFTIRVTEVVTRDFEFDTEEEAREALASGDYWDLPGEVVDSEVAGEELLGC